MASRKDLRPRFSVYQLGRGNEPVMVVGNSWFAVARSIESPVDVFFAAGGVPTFLAETDTILEKPRPHNPNGSSNRSDELGPAAAELTERR
jgi:hypothetical protein